MPVSTLIALVVLSPALALGPSASGSGHRIGGTQSVATKRCEESLAGCLGTEARDVPAASIGGSFERPSDNALNSAIAGIGNDEPL